MTEESLDWLALQYVLDELPEPARGQFETRLINDLAACEAVARVTRLRFGIEQSMLTTDSAIVREEVERPSRRAPIAVAAAVTVLAALLLVAVIIPRLSHNQMASQPILNPMEREHVELVALWRTAMNEADTETDAGSDETDEESFDPAHDAALPSWLLAAVSLEINDQQNQLPANQKDH